MAFFEQAAVLATAWANEESLKALGANCSLIQVTSKKLTRRPLHACSACVCKFPMHTYEHNDHKAKVYWEEMPGPLGWLWTSLACGLHKT